MQDHLGSNAGFRGGAARPSQLGSVAFSNEILTG